MEKLKSLFVVMALSVFSITSNAAPATTTVDALNSHEMKSLAKGWLSAEVDATDNYVSAYDIRGLSRISKLDSYFVRLLGGADGVSVEMIDRAQLAIAGADSMAFELAKDLMQADPYASAPSLKDIGKVVEPLAKVLADSNFEILTAQIADEEFHVSQNALIVVDRGTKEAIVIAVGYSE